MGLEFVWKSATGWATVHGSSEADRRCIMGKQVDGESGPTRTLLFVFPPVYQYRKSTAIASRQLAVRDRCLRRYG